MSDFISLGHWSTNRVFISSTFIDMGPERDLLVKTVLPRLRILGEERQQHIAVVDLRWGIPTQNETEKLQVVDRCLSAVDICRPFFLGLIGARRGWIPERKDVDDNCFKKYPKLFAALDSKLSLTEIEILHALCPLDNRDVQPPKITVFSQLLDGYGLASPLVSAFESFGISRDALPELIQLRHYEKTEIGDGDFLLTCNDMPLESQLLADLTNSLDLTGVPSHLSAINSHERVRAISIIDAPPAETELHVLNEEIAGGGRFVVVEGKAESGPTTFLAQVVTQQLQSKSHEIIFRFLGAAELPDDEELLIRSLYDELNSHLSEPGQAVVEHQELRTKWSEAWKSAVQDHHDLLLILEGLDQVPLNTEALQWLFAPIWVGATVIVSLDPESDAGRQIMMLLAEHDFVYRLRPYDLTSDQARREFINARLALHLKALDKATASALLENPAAKDPLFLSIVLSELRIHGRHDDLSQEIDRRFAGGIEGALRSLLERLLQEQQALGEYGVAIVLGALARSQSGLSTLQLAQLVDGDQMVRPETQAEIEGLLYQIAPFLQRRPFAHAMASQRFRMAIRERFRNFVPTKSDWSGAIEVLWNQRLAVLHLDTLSLNDNSPSATAAYIRALRDLPHHLRAAGHVNQLASHLLEPKLIGARLRFIGVSGFRAHLQTCSKLVTSRKLRQDLEELGRVIVGATNSIYQLSEEVAPQTTDFVQLMATQAGLLQAKKIEKFMLSQLSNTQRYARVRDFQGSRVRQKMINAQPDWIRIVLSRSGKWLLTLGDKGQALLWNTGNLYKHMEWGDDESLVRAAAFSIDESVLVICMNDGRMQFIQMNSGLEVHAALKLESAAVSVCWITDTLLVCALEKGSIVELDLVESSQRQARCEGARIVRALPKDHSVLVGTKSGKLYKYKLPLQKKNSPTVMGQDGEDEIIALALDSQESRAWTINGRFTLLQWDLTTGGTSSPFEIFRPLDDLVVHPNGEELLVSNAVGELVIYNIESHEHRTLNCVQNAAVSVAIDVHGETWVAGQPGNEAAEVVSIALREENSDVSFDPIFGVALSPDGRIAVDLRYSGRVWARDARNGQALFDLEPAENTRAFSRAFCCRFNESGSVLMTGMLDRLMIVDPWRHQILAHVGAMGSWQNYPFDGVRAIAIDSDDRFFVAGDSQGHIAAFDRTYNAFATTRLDSPPSSIEVLPSQNVLIAEENGQVSCFDPFFSQRILWPKAPDRCWAMAVAPLHGTFYTSHGDGQIARWKLDVCSDPEWLDAGVGEIESLHVLTGESVLVVGGRRGILRFLDLNDWNVLLDLYFPGAIENVAFSGDNRTILLSLAQGVLVTLDLVGFSTEE